MQQSSHDTRHIEDEAQSITPHEGALQPGQVLQNRYRILGILGIGGMGAVYQARDLHFPNVTKLCAVKEMINVASDQALREQMTRNFEREAEILATLSHPAIPQIYDYFSFGDRAYLVMEYIQGKDLEAILNSTDQFLPSEQVRRWAIEICDVLHYLHSHQPPIVFRDMKPSNVMIDHHRRVRLIDFGIAKAFQMGQKGTMIGTEGYSPPEQYKGEASPAGDVYALGATLHHLLTRVDPRLELPFSFEDRAIRQYNPEVPEELAAIVMRSLTHDPVDRFASAEAMKQALEALDPDIAFDRAAFASGIPGAVAPSGIVAAEAGLGPEGIIPIWAFKVEDEIRSSPIVVNDVVYFGAYDNNVWALDARKGSLLWKFPTDGGIGSSPTYSAGMVFIGSEDRRLYALDIRSGKKRWSFPTEGRIFTTPRVAVGHVFFGADDGTFYALKISAGGRKAWAYSTTGPIRSSPFIAEETVYFGSETGDFYALDVSGELRWHFRARRGITSSPLVHERIVYFGANDWNLYALDAETGFLIWRFRARKHIVSSPRIREGKLFIGSADGNIYAIDALSGRELWHYQAEDQVTSTPCIHKEFIFVGSVDKHLYCLHAETGDLIWRYQTGGPVVSSPTVEGDMVYIGSTDHHLYAFPA